MPIVFHLANLHGKYNVEVNNILVRMPLYDGDVQSFGSDRSLPRCHRNFLSLLHELSSVGEHEKPLHELPQDDKARILFPALQGWRIVTAAHAGYLFQQYETLAAAELINAALLTLLYTVCDLARADSGGIGPAMLMVIVSARLRHTVRRKAWSSRAKSLIPRSTTISDSVATRRTLIH